jgi:hypothetical protein
MCRHPCILAAPVTGMQVTTIAASAEDIAFGGGSDSEDEDGDGTGSARTPKSAGSTLRGGRWGGVCLLPMLCLTGNRIAPLCSSTNHDHSYVTLRVCAYDTEQTGLGSQQCAVWHHRDSADAVCGRYPWWHPRPRALPNRVCVGVVVVGLCVVSSLSTSKSKSKCTLN